MKIHMIQPFLIFLICPFFLWAQPETVLNGLRMTEPLERVIQKVKPIAEDSKVITIEKPRFPLAAKTEVHLVCSNVKTDHGIINRAVFTFADDKLEYILASGNVYPVFAENRRDTSEVYMDYDIYSSENLFLHRKKDLAWILTEEATHPNLFTWVNPYIEWDYQPEAELANTDSIPAFLKMGLSLEEIKPVLEKHSDYIVVQELDGSDPNAQVQINCFGVEYLGFPRKIEARFGDSKLNVIWILTGKGDEERIRESLVKQFGPPIFVNADWEIFDDWQVGLRKDKPEVLLMEKEIGLGYKTTYFKQ